MTNIFGTTFHDFAGSTVVPPVGGWIALVGAAVLGPRIGKYGKDGRSKAIPGHNLTLAPGCIHSLVPVGLVLIRVLNWQQLPVLIRQLSPRIP